MSTLRSIVVSAALLTLPAAAQDHRFEADPVVNVSENFVACDVLSQRRLAIMANVGAPNAMLDMREVAAAARTLGVEVVTLEIQVPGKRYRQPWWLQGNRSPVSESGDNLAHKIKSFGTKIGRLA